MLINLLMLFFIIAQPMCGWKNPYVRYEAVGPTVIFDDLR